MKKAILLKLLIILSFQYFCFQVKFCLANGHPNFNSYKVDTKTQEIKSQKAVFNSKLAPSNEKTSVKKVLFRRTEIAKVALDGAYMLDAITELIEEASSKVRNLVLFPSTKNVRVEEERLSSIDKPPEPKWKTDVKNFDFLVNVIIIYKERQKYNIGDPLSIDVKETWSVEKVSDQSSKKEWNLTHSIWVSENIFGKNAAKPFARRKILSIIGIRAPVFTEIMQFIDTMPFSAEKAAVDFYIQMLKNKDGATRKIAAANLGNLKPHSNKAIPNLIRVLTDSKADVRAAAAGSLGEIGPEAKPSIDSLMKLFKDPSSKVRIRSAEAVSKLGEYEAAIPVLMEFLKEGAKPWDVEAAVSVLGDIGPPASIAVPALSEIAGKRGSSAYKAIQTLGKIGQAAKKSVPVLLKSLEARGDGARRFYAAEALTRIDLEAAKAGLSIFINYAKKKSYFSKRAIVSLGRIGPEAAEALPTLVECLDNPDEEIRIAAKEAMQKIKR
jgi:HEAT repeat protein